MINIGNILKRSWHILWNYKVLWIFGVLLALTTSNGGSGNGRASSSGSRSTGSGGNGSFPGDMENMPGWMRQMAEWFNETVVPLFTQPQDHIGTFVTIGVVIFLLVVVISLLAALVRYPAETAVMRMVDGYEASAAKVGFRQGWRLGWTRRAFRLWVIDLILSIPPFVLVLLMLGAGVIVYFSVSSTFEITNVLGVVVAIGLGFVSLFTLIILAIFLSLLRNLFARVAALEDLGVRASLRRGWEMFKGNWKSVALMWLVMIGIGLGVGIAGMIVFFLLIPAYLVLLVPAALVAAVPGALAFGVTSLFAGGPPAWIAGALVAMPFFFTVLFAPMLVFGGWFKIYESNVWTLTYREIKALENLAVSGSPLEAAASPE